MNLSEIQDIRIADFDYPLPDERIARHPLEQRDACKLLLSRPDGRHGHFTFRDLPGLLPYNSLMICNNTRVINARIRFRKASGATIEVFLLEPYEPNDYVLSFQTKGKCQWVCMVGNLKRWKDEFLKKEIIVDGKFITLKARRMAESPGNSRIVEFTWDDTDCTWASIVGAAGHIPIPPYLKRESEECDSDDYQTVYSRIEGSVAAPTAGLHFTDAVLDDIRAHNIEIDSVTLHVGAGTFQPVKSEDIGSHPMHTETFSVSSRLIRNLIDAINNGKKITAVGTTSVRTIESLPYLGHHLLRGDENMRVSQWEAYAPENKDISTPESLRAIENHMKANNLSSLTASTAIMIAPGFRWRLTDCMVTNFHQPQSTLLLLVSSFLDGDNLSDPQWKKLYAEALANDYRFLSYGDACIFYPLKK